MKPSLFAALTALLAPISAQGAILQDPDRQPEIREGMRVLGFRDDVKVYLADEFARIDTEPMYAADTGSTVVFFRGGEELCMTKYGFAFVPCNGDEALATSDPDLIGAAFAPGAAIPTGIIGDPGGPSSMPIMPWIPGGSCCGSDPPPDHIVDPLPAPIPLPAALLLLLTGLGMAVTIGRSRA